MQQHKIIRIIIAAITCILLVGCTEYWGKNDGFYGNLDMRVSDSGRKAFAGQYFWDGTMNDLVIDVPDEFGKAKVLGIGGFIGSGASVPFMIMPQYPGFEVDKNPELKNKLSDEEKKAYAAKSHLNKLIVFYKGPEKKKYDAPIAYKELVFTLNIGKNVNRIHTFLGNDYIGIRQKNRKIIFYAPVVRVNCPPENKTFYSKDGKLYYKKDGKLVDSFNYQGSVKFP